MDEETKQILNELSIAVDMLVTNNCLDDAIRYKVVQSNTAIARDYITLVRLRLAGAPEEIIKKYSRKYYEG